MVYPTIFRDLTIRLVVQDFAGPSTGGHQGICTLGFSNGPSTCHESSKTLRGSDWSLADRPLDTGLPMGRYCDLASFDGRRCVVRGTLFDTEEMVPNSEASIFVEVTLW